MIDRRKGELVDPTCSVLNHTNVGRDEDQTCSVLNQQQEDVTVGSELLRCAGAAEDYRCPRRTGAGQRTELPIAPPLWVGHQLPGPRAL